MRLIEKRYVTGTLNDWRQPKTPERGKRGEVRKGKNY